MTLFPRLIEQFGFWQLNKSLKSQQRQKYAHNLDSARSLGVLFNASSESHFEEVLRFYKQLKKPDNEISVLGYSNHKDLPNQYLFKKDFTFYQRKDLTWMHKPVSADVNLFTSRSYDILIDLSLSTDFHFQYIIALTKASFKVGHFTRASRYCDLMIKVDDNPTIEYLIEQVNHYLSIINKPYYAVTDNI